LVRSESITLRSGRSNWLHQQSLPDIGCSMSETLDPAKWLALAQEVVVVAEGLHDVASKLVLLEIATKCEAMAKRAEALAQPAE
jgi:hypothetical protein